MARRGKERTPLVTKARELEKEGKLEQAYNIYQKIKEKTEEKRKTLEERKEKFPNYENFECLKTLEGHKDSVWSIIETKDGKLASGGWDKTIKIWGEKE